MKEIKYYSAFTNFEIESLDKNRYLVIPIGSVEAHGHHLSTNNDNLIAQYLARELCRVTNSILCEPLLFGNTEALSDFPGTIHVRPKILEEYLFDILSSYGRASFKNVLIINAHYGNVAYINNAIARMEEMNVKNFYYKDVAKESRDDTYGGLHSNRLETEMAMLAKFDSVRLDDIKDFFFKDKSLISEKFHRHLLPDCVDGFPSKSTLESAKIAAERIISELSIEVID